MRKETNQTEYGLFVSVFFRQSRLMNIMLLRVSRSLTLLHCSYTSKLILSINTSSPILPFQSNNSKYTRLKRTRTKKQGPQFLQKERRPCSSREKCTLKVEDESPSFSFQSHGNRVLLVIRYRHIKPHRQDLKR